MGKRRALLIGFKQERLYDVVAVHSMLISVVGYNSGSILVLTDSEKISSIAARKPTVENVIKGLRWLKEDVQDGDQLFLFWSGKNEFAFHTYIKHHAPYMNAFLGSLPYDCSLVMMLETIPKDGGDAVRWPFNWRANSSTTPDVTILQRLYSDTLPTGPRVVLFSSMETSNFESVELQSSHCHSMFCKAVLLGLSAGRMNDTTPIDFLMTIAKEMSTFDKQFSVSCSTLNPIHFHQQMWL